MRIIYESFDVNVDYSWMNTCFFFYIEEKVNVSKRSDFIKWWNVINCNKYGLVQRFQMGAFLKIFFFFLISLISLLKYFYIRNKKKNTLEMKKFQSRNFEKIFLIYRYWIFFFFTNWTKQRFVHAYFMELKHQSDTSKLFCKSSWCCRHKLRRILHGCWKIY